MRAEARALGAAFASVTERVERACQRAGRDPASVAVLPVTKGVPAERIRAALSAGMSSFGENRVQDAVGKATELAAEALAWELVGRLQSNKAARALDVFTVIHSVDSVGLARRLDRLAAATPGRRPLAIYLQVNVDADPAKAGFTPAGLGADLAELVTLDNLRLCGLMTVGRRVTAPAQSRPAFAALRELSTHLRRDQPGLLAGLSMGMSADFEVAVEEGATVVRVGSAIFGRRGYE